jgi:hypothetical protein
VATALEARLLALEAKAVAQTKKAIDVDPDDTLDYVPNYEGRGLNPHQVRPQGVTDKPQLYPLREQGYEVYRYLFSKKNAAYHEIGTLACALSCFWDARHLLESWADKFAECGDENAPLTVMALVNSLDGIYGLLNRRKNLVELRATRESNSPKLQPTEQEKKLFDYLTNQLDGFATNHGLDSSIDPYFKAVLRKFEDEASSSAVRHLVQLGDWMVSCDLEDGYHAVGIHDSHQRYMTASLDGKLYSCAALPFGWLGSPAVFGKITKVLTQALRAPDLKMSGGRDVELSGSC